MWVIATEAIGMTGIADPERLTIIALLLLVIGGFNRGTWVMGRELQDEKKRTQEERERANKYEAIVMRLVGVAEKLLQERSGDADRRVS